MLCPVCDSARTRDAFRVRDFQVLECSACGHRFADVHLHADHARTVYDDDYFTGGGAGYVDYGADAAELRRRGRTYGELMASHGAPGRLLDVGAACGYILTGLMDAGWDGVGLEPNGTMVERARSELGVTMIHGTLEELPIESQFDAVTLIQVLPHLWDLRAGVGNAARALRPGGLCLVETWNRESFAARLFGKSWHEYSPPSVLHWFSRGGVARLFEREGVEVVAGGRPRRRVLGEHARSVLRYVGERRWWGAALRGVGRLIPADAMLPYPADDLIWVLLRKR